MGFKKEIKYFDVVDYKKEESWLEEQYRKGWSLRKVKGNTYEFKRIEPTMVLYRMDYLKKKELRDALIQSYTDAGWEFVAENRGWHYFRKLEESLIMDEEYEQAIFESRNERVVKYFIYLKRTIPYVVIAFFSVAVVLNIIISFVSEFNRGELITDIIRALPICVLVTIPQLLILNSKYNRVIKSEN